MKFSPDDCEDELPPPSQSGARFQDLPPPSSRNLRIPPSLRQDPAQLGKRKMTGKTLALILGSAMFAAGGGALDVEGTSAPLPISTWTEVARTPAPSHPMAVKRVKGFSQLKQKVQQGVQLCPSGMTLVSGEYCTNVRHECIRWLDDKNLPFARCAEYQEPASCVGELRSMHFCMDTREHTRPGESLPANHQSFVEAARVCKEQGKRVCSESEWNFACEGEEMRPYPYGFSRQPVCNQDRDDLYENNPKRRVLRDLRAPGGAHPQCQSPFGVLDLVGNLDEPVLREGPHRYPFRNALKGGWWMAGRNRCRPATTAHDDHYSDIQVGIRCCSDFPGSSLEG